LRAEGLKTVGEIRARSDRQLLVIRDLGNGSIAQLRASLGLASVRVAKQAESSDT
jgi:DNA-directed RNA polymerase alpha subunit